MNADLNQGQLLTSRRPNPKFNRKASDYKTCGYCFEILAKSSLRHHVARNCPKKPLKRIEGERIITLLGTRVEARVHVDAKDGLKQRTATIRNDTVSQTIRHDWLLILYGNKIEEKFTRHSQKRLVNSKLRLAGRVLIALKIINPEVTDFASLYAPSHYDSVLEAIRRVANYNETNGEYGIPWNASNLATLIKEIGKLLAVEYIKKGDSINQLKTENFLKVLATDYPFSISKSVTETKIKRRKKSNIPSLEDVKKLARYVDSERNTCFEQLKKKYSYKNWRKLAGLVIASIIIYNRKRPGETENTEVIDFTDREAINEETNGQLFSAMSPESQQVAKNFCRMQVRGKLGRTVSVLMKPEVEESLKLFFSLRQKAGISTDNDLLFALPTSVEGRIRWIKAGPSLKKCAEECGALDPSSLTGINLRKHFATFCVSLKLCDGTVAEVADFMGHSELVHRNYYRHNTIDRQVVTVSRLLDAAQGNSSDNQNMTMMPQPMINQINQQRSNESSSQLSQQLYNTQAQNNADIAKFQQQMYNQQQQNISTGLPQQQIVVNENNPVITRKHIINTSTAQGQEFIRSILQSAVNANIYNQQSGYTPFDQPKQRVSFIHTVDEQQQVKMAQNQNDQQQQKLMSVQKPMVQQQDSQRIIISQQEFNQVKPQQQQQTIQRNQPVIVQFPQSQQTRSQIIVQQPGLVQLAWTSQSNDEVLNLE